MILSEGPSDRAALTGFFTSLYEMIDPDIEVFFPILSEESLNEEGITRVKYNGDITTRYGINQDNILPLILKLFIHPELKKHPAYDYPKYIYEVIHLVDIDGAYLKDSNILKYVKNDMELPYYDDKQNHILTDDVSSLIDRNKRKRENLNKMIYAGKLRITVEKGANESREKPYRVYYFSTNLDHILHDRANNERYFKVRDAEDFANRYYDDPLKMAEFFLNHEAASPVTDYEGSWQWLMEEDTLSPKTNINVLIKDLLDRTKKKI